MENESSHCSSAGTDGKITERSRRNQMKALCSRLYSLVPCESSREATNLPDQLEDATNYIKKMQTELEELKEKRDEFMGMERPNGKTPCSAAESRSPKVKVREVAGRAVEVLLITALDYYSIFRQTVRLLQEEGAEIVSATQSMFPDRVLHRIVAEVVGDGLVPAGIEAARISEKLKKLLAI